MSLNSSYGESYHDQVNQVISIKKLLGHDHFQGYAISHLPKLMTFNHRLLLAEIYFE